MSDGKKLGIKIGVLVVFLIIVLIILSQTESCQRKVVDIKSDFGGLERVVNVYTANGDLLASYHGKIDIEDADGGYVKFDFDGKRYIYYNCFVETIADIP